MLVRSFLPASLLKDTIQRSRRQIVAWLAGNRHTTRFRLMFELPMTTPRGNEEPAILS